jgi:hypothetical protein
MRGTGNRGKRAPPPDDKEQSARFVDTAKKLWADATGKTFEHALNVVAHSKSKPIGERNPQADTLIEDGPPEASFSKEKGA